MEKVKIERLDDFGNGIGKINGKIIFIPHTYINEVVLCDIKKETKNYLVGEMVELLEKSEKRIDSKCPYYGICGGCSLQHLSYEDGINYKKEKIQNLLRRKKLYDKEILIVKNEQDYFYRNKIELKLENGKLGFYEQNTHKLVEIKECVITKESINNVLKSILKTGLKNAQITIRSNYNDELLLIIDTQEQFDYSKLIPGNKIAGIILNKKVIYNDSYFVEQVDDLYFRVSYDAFFQINEHIYKKLFSLLSSYIKKDSVVADLYCGVGILSLIASKKAKKVYGIEIVENAILDAIKNTAINHINNAYFMVGSVPVLFPKIKDLVDTVIVDPPRFGLDKKTVSLLLDYKPNTIIYVSCNPSTLVRDLENLTSDYEIKEITLFDMFSYTYHVESVVLLEKKKR